MAIEVESVSTSDILMSQASWSKPLMQAISLLLVYSFVDGRLSASLLERPMTQFDPTMLSMSVFLGLYAFGLTGIVYGPLLVSMGTIYFRASNMISNEDKGKKSYSVDKRAAQ